MKISITEKGIKSNNSTRVVSCFEMILRMHTKPDVDVVGSNILRARLRLISKTKLTQILMQITAWRVEIRALFQVRIILEREAGCQFNL